MTTPLLKSSFFACFLFLYAMPVAGQQTEARMDPRKNFREGLELYNKQLYGAAQEAFGRAVDASARPYDETATEAEYYYALCAIALFNADAEARVTTFSYNHSAHPNAAKVHFQLGLYHFQNKSYKKAANRFRQTDVYDLSGEEVPEYYFKYGYSLFAEERPEEASRNFFQIKDSDSKYAGLARYYHAHIAYTQGNNETALQGFLGLVEDENFAPIVPYYISQIYYLQNRYDSLIAFATPLLEKAIPKRAGEIARLLGDAYYRTGRFSEAIPFLEQYMEKAYYAGREDRYQLGYAYYKSSNWEKCVETLKGILSVNDSLTQYAYYHLADAYYRFNEKTSAQNAYAAAARLKFDPEVAENALYNYAKLSYELSFNPYNRAIYAFQDYLKKYPRSDRKEEVYQYLMNIFFTTHNYKGALEVLDNIPAKDAAQQAAYQTLAYYRGLELLSGKRYEDALAHFEKSLNYKTDQKTVARATFWSGEAWYQLGRYDEALARYEAFALMPGSFDLDIFPLYYYGSAYALYKKQDYAAATGWFRRFVDDKRPKAKSKINDALLRIADGYYLNKDFYNALEYYSKALAVGVADVDYGLYQKSMVMGILSKYQEKISALEKLLAEHKGSGYASAAHYELGNSFNTLNQPDKAIQHYGKVETDYPSSMYVKDAILRRGLIHFQSGEQEKARIAFEKVASEHMGSEAAREALSALKDIYVEKGDVEGYFTWVREKLPGTSIDMGAQDSITYQAAYHRYFKSDCIGAVRDFTAYLERFPDGIFSTHANFYKAECEGFAEQYESALAGYEKVIARSKGIFTEKALVTAASIYMDRREYGKALEHFRTLEALAESQANRQAAVIGQMRALGALEDIPQAGTQAGKVLGLSKLDKATEVEAHMWIAQAAFSAGDHDRAEKEYQWVYKNSRSSKAAQALYQMAVMKHNRQDYKGSAEIIFRLIDELTSYDEWVTRGLLLLAENYYQQGDLFQAKYTLQSVLDDCKISELRQLAQQRLQKIEEEEKASKVKKKREELEIELNGNPPPPKGTDREDDHEE